jgi:hypothetical protein
MVRCARALSTLTHAPHCVYSVVELEGLAAMCICLSLPKFLPTLLLYSAGTDMTKTIHSLLQHAGVRDAIILSPAAVHIVDACICGCLLSISWYGLADSFHYCALLVHFAKV